MFDVARQCRCELTAGRMKLWSRANGFAVVLSGNYPSSRFLKIETSLLHNRVNLLLEKGTTGRGHKAHSFRPSPTFPLMFFNFGALCVPFMQIKSRSHFNSFGESFFSRFRLAPFVVVSEVGPARMV